MHSYGVEYQYFGTKDGVLRIYPGACLYVLCIGMFIYACESCNEHIIPRISIFLCSIASDFSVLDQCLHCPIPSKYTFDIRRRPW